MRTVKEKFDYNSRQKTEFSQGYCAAVILYGESRTPQERKKHNAIIDDMKADAQAGDKFSKGYMCAIRDCANERKAKAR